MPVNGGLDNLLLGSLFPLVRVAVVVIMLFYSLYALLIIRQVNLMEETLSTPQSGIIKALSILHAGFAIGFTILVYGILS